MKYTSTTRHYEMIYRNRDEGAQRIPYIEQAFAFLDDAGAPIIDKRGRQFGCSVQLYLEDGQARVRPQAQRGGKSYGATQPYQAFDTLEQRDAWVKRYIEGSYKRALTHKDRAAA